MESEAEPEAAASEAAVDVVSLWLLAFPPLRELTRTGPARLILPSIPAQSPSSLRLLPSQPGQFIPVRTGNWLLPSQPGQFIPEHTSQNILRPILPSTSGRSSSTHWLLPFQPGQCIPARTSHALPWDLTAPAEASEPESEPGPECGGRGMGQGVPQSGGGGGEDDVTAASGSEGSQRGEGRSKGALP